MSTPVARCSRAPLISFPDCLSLSSIHPLYGRPPFPLPSSPFCSLLFYFSLYLYLSLSHSLSSTYPSHGLVRRWNIGEQSENRRESGGMKQHPIPTVLPLSTPYSPFLPFPLAYSFAVSLSAFLSLSLSRSFSFIRSLNAANKNNTRRGEGMYGGCGEL